MGVLRVFVWIAIETFYQSKHKYSFGEKCIRFCMLMLFAAYSSVSLVVCVFSIKKICNSGQCLVLGGGFVSLNLNLEIEIELKIISALSFRPAEQSRGVHSHFNSSVVFY